MLTERSTYQELYAALQKAMSVNFSKHPSYSGQRQRARLQGRPFFFCELRSGDHSVMLMEHSRDRYCMAMLLVPGCDSEGCDLPSVVMRQIGADDQEHLFILRGHAIKRYIQRRIHHDDHHTVSLIEYRRHMHAIVEAMTEVYAEYDSVSQCHLLAYDGGVFIIPAETPDHIATAETYQVVSRMFVNQRIARGKSEQGTKHLRNILTDDMRRRFAYLETIKQLK